ncbi:hypothetical protein [Streptomyces sp. NPDC048489]
MHDQNQLVVGHGIIDVPALAAARTGVATGRAHAHVTPYVPHSGRRSD